jgi:hypothetical protein
VHTYKHTHTHREREREREREGYQERGSHVDPLWSASRLVCVWNYGLTQDGRVIRDNR